MKLMTTTCIATLGAIAAGPIWAEATDAGAAELLSVFQTYLGTTEGVVSVAVAGDDYAVTLDPGAMMAALPLEGLAFTVSPIEMTLTDNGDGTWNYGIDQAITMDYAMQGLMSAKTTYGSFIMNGVFDEALGDSSEFSIEVTGISASQTQADPNMGEVMITTAVESYSMTGNAAEGAAGVDGGYTSLLSGMVYGIELPASEGVPVVQISVLIAQGTADFTLTGYQPKSLYSLLAWFVAHPNEAAIMSDKAGLKAQLAAAIPFFETASIAGAYTDISVDSPVGAFGLDEVAVALDMNGIVTDGLFREAITLKGLSLPEGLVPPFAVPMIPEEVAIDVTASGFDLATTAQLALGMLDLPEGSERPEGFDMQMLAALMPEGAVDIILAPGGVKNAAYNLTYVGAMRAGMDGMPTGTAKITFAGIDAIMAALQAAPPEMTGQVLPVLGMAQAMGQPGAAGELVWDIDASAPGSLKVNGMDMMGGQ